MQVGAKTRSEKSGRWYFNPEKFDDNEDVKWFHMHCMQTTFDFTNAPDDPDDDRNCMFCGGPLASEALYYEFALGRFFADKKDTIWTPTFHQSRGVRKTVRSYACHDCVFEGLGEGNGEMARYILGMDALPEDDEPIQRSPRIPMRTKGVRTIPRRTAAR